MDENLPNIKKISYAHSSWFRGGIIGLIIVLLILSFKGFNFGSSRALSFIYFIMIFFKSLYNYIPINWILVFGLIIFLIAATVFGIGALIGFSVNEIYLQLWKYKKRNIGQLVGTIFLLVILLVAIFPLSISASKDSETYTRARNLYIMDKVRDTKDAVKALNLCLEVVDQNIDYVSKRSCISHGYYDLQLDDCYEVKPSVIRDYCILSYSSWQKDNESCKDVLTPEIKEDCYNKSMGCKAWFGGLYENGTTYERCCVFVREYNPDGSIKSEICT